MKAAHKKEIIADKSLIAACGLYCGACRSYLNEKCPGCRENVKATWCKTRQCVLENNYLSCADCTQVDYNECKKFNNFISRTIGFILNSDRGACIEMIRKTGYEGFALDRAKSRSQTLPRR